MRRRVRCDRGSHHHSLTERGIGDFVLKCLTLTLFVSCFAHSRVQRL